MEKKPLNLERLIAFRRHMHQNPETGFKEFETQKNIKAFLLQLGIDESLIKVCGSTGYTIDLQGKAPATGNPRRIALRADIDALQMVEQNPHLAYQSTNGAAHMCGHDGHTTCLLAFVELYLNILDTIPSDQIVRLLFQPSEEGPDSGALAMIKDGCLEGVDEVYGFHNWPTHKVGHLMVKPGPMMSEVTVINLDIIGKGGHGSEPERANDPIQAAVDFHVKFREIQQRFQGRKYVCTLPIFQAGTRFNVIPDKAFISGTLRSFEEGLTEEFEKCVREALQELKAERGIDFDLKWRVYFPILNNTETEAKHVERVAKQFFGEDHVDHAILPVKASEDFAFYTQKVPGAFFFLGSGRIEYDTMLHDSHFDFNEDLIKPAGEFWIELVKDRLLNKN